MVYPIQRLGYEGVSDGTAQGEGMFSAPAGAGRGCCDGKAGEEKGSLLSPYHILYSCQSLEYVYRKQNGTCACTLYIHVHCTTHL